MRPILVPLLAIACGLLAAPAADAAQDAAACEAAKLKACATSALAQLKCHALAEKKGIAVDTACLTRAETKFRIAFDRIDSRGGCATTGDSADYEVEVDAFVADIVGENLCSAKIKAAGSAAQGLLKCWARATKKSEAVDTDCLDKADAKLASAFTKADSKGCTPTGGTAVVQAHADALVDSLVGPVAPADIRIFLGFSAGSGNLGNRATTNAACSAAATTQGLSCSSVVSLLSYSGDTIADFPTNFGVPTGVPLIAGAADVTVATNWADFVDGTWQTCLGSQCRPAGPTPAALVSDTSGIWTGATPNGALAANCSNWTEGTVDFGSNASARCYGVSDGDSCETGDALGQPSGGASCAAPSQSVLCLCY